MKQPVARGQAFFSTGEGVTLGGSFLNLALTLVKVAAGVLGQSSALIADAVHSLSDLVSDILVLFGYRVGRMPEDPQHPYGHGKVETACTVAVGGILIVVGASLGWSALATLLRSVSPVRPGWVALAAAGLSVAVKETLYRWTARVARRTDSQLLLANAWHHRSDALSSIAALAGVAGARLGAPWMDPGAALLVCAFVVKVGWDLGWQALQDLLDAAVDDQLLQDLASAISRVDGVQGYHELRARRLGRDVLVDVDVEVDPELSVIQGHDVARAVRRSLLTRLKNVRDAMVHVEPVGAREGGLFAKSRRDAVRRAAEQLARRTQGVLGVHGVRVIPTELGYILNLDIEVAPELTVEEAHAISHQIQEAMAQVPGISDAVIHVDVHGSGSTE